MHELHQHLAHCASQATQTAHGARGLIYTNTCRTLGWVRSDGSPNIQRLMRALKKYGMVVSHRKPRADQGKTRLSEEALRMIAAAKRESIRGNGNAIMPTVVAMNIADANGCAINVSKSRINALLKNQRMRPMDLANARNTGNLRSSHPNHVHQIDPSLCVLFYSHGTQQIMDAEQFYKNKPDAYNKIKLKLWRYVRYDHASGCIDVQYYEAEGENQQSLFDFLMHTWGKQTHRLSHGVPQILLWDKGSANTSHAIGHLLDALGVQHQTHAAHHAWAKGGVESANRIVENHFESRLRLEPTNSVAELNTAVNHWVRVYNANVIRHVDSRIKRASGDAMVRDELWQTITATQLKLMPTEQVCRWFFHGSEQLREVRNLEIKFRHPELGGSATYSLKAWADCLAKKIKVRVMPLLGREGMVRVLIDRLGQEALAVEVAPVSNFDRYGRSMDAQLIGDGYSSMPDDQTMQKAKQLNQQAYGVSDIDEADKQRTKNTRPFADANNGKGLVAHSNLQDAQSITRLVPRGGDLPIATAIPHVELQPLTTVQAALQLRGALGRSLSPKEFAYLQTHYSNAIPPDDIPRLTLHFSAQIVTPIRSIK